jgi:FKBP-type peptidyl-prolyl cis-trans isomerase SlyD
MSKPSIEEGKVVHLAFTLKDGEGNILEVATHDDPMIYLHGYGNLPPGLEAALSGRGVGEQFQAMVSALEGYGEYEPAHRQSVERGLFPEGDLEPGMPIMVESEGDAMQFFIVEVGEDEVVLDGNHPYAGKELDFDVTVTEIRDAQAEEIEHGHAHGPDGHEDH